jgi:PEGA domain-containing protein/protein kinase-like protein
VFRTYEPTRDRLVAVKVFRLDIIPEQAQVLADALSRAAESSLVHPSIVEPIASGVEGTLAYRAEEYVAAESLDVAMRHYAPASIDKALPFITQLAGAIDFARAAGVGHGGLHPRDIFMTPDEARATGFGVVEALERVGIRAPIRRPYSAPERIAGAAWGTPADVFALAAITFELLTARRPAGTGAQIGTLPESERAGALHAVLARAMDDDPARRYVSALAFAGALGSAARNEVPSPLVPESPVPETTVPRAAFIAVPTEGSEDTDEVADFIAERDLDPARAVGAGPGAEATLFDDDEPEIEAAAGLAIAHDSKHERFADDFAEEDTPAFVRATAGEDRHDPVEESHDVVERPMFSARHEPDYRDGPDRSGPVILPIAVTAVLCLLAGFGGGYFVGSRDRLVPAAERGSGATGPQTAPAPAGPATPEKPGQYSEQKVSPPAPVTEPAPAPSTAPPAATRGTPPASSPAGAPRPARTGHLVVRSTPSRAAVTLNGAWRGRTPLTLDALPFGTYIVRVVQDGFRVTREEVTLSPRDASHTIDARLERIGSSATARSNPAQAPGRSVVPPPVSLTGSLYVDSRPRGASVIVDGKSVGVTPLSLADVPAGSHVVRIEMEGKRPWTSTALVTAGKRTPVTGSLEDR